MIEGAAFDAGESILCVRFRDSGTYFYFDVPEELFDGLCSAASTGAFFNERIKDRFRCERDPDQRRFIPAA
ncbi:KTSC domain-containing protein [Sphingopyxis panaciterrae]